MTRNMARGLAAFAVLALAAGINLAAQKPESGLLPRDEGCEIKRLGDCYPADLSRGHLGEHEVVVRAPA